jgi:hypothetical protein
LGIRRHRAKNPGTPLRQLIIAALAGGAVVAGVIAILGEHCRWCTDRISRSSSGTVTS